jgi:hypothetical protein
MIKKYGIGLSALIIAFCAAAFTSPAKHPLGTKLFRYTVPGGSYSLSNVENKGNWTFVTGTPNCPSNFNAEACEMDVDDSQINPDNTLKSSFTITASESQPNVSYVSGITSGTIHNKNL